MPVFALRRPVQLPPQPAVARRELKRLLDDRRWKGDTDGVILAVHEAMVNAHRHGGGVTRVTAGFEGQALVVRISDRGRGFDVPECPEPTDTAAERGRGLFLIRQLATDAHVERAGKDVELVLAFTP